MKTFRWVNMSDVKGNSITILFDVTNYKEMGTLLAVGSVVPAGSEFRPIIQEPEYTTTIETMSFLDAQEAVENKLYADGVIGEGDEIEYTNQI